jgi:tRNA/tmRNA/rRNA uracil-C5-methylase (TrmA/RlmC/RlmD family)
MRQSGFFRHLIIRKTHFTNQMMLILGFNNKYKDKLDSEIKMIEDFFQELASKYSEIKSVYLSYNPNKADIAIGDLELIY